jgi:hypothetical protein
MTKTKKEMNWNNLRRNNYKIALKLSFDTQSNLNIFMYATYDSPIYSPVTSKCFRKPVPMLGKKISDHKSCHEDSNTKYISVRMRLKSRIQAIKDKSSTPGWRKPTSLTRC